ncbi:sulfotransferase [Acetobacter fallax]|nr:sulfotransferase [Acetobacter fallax]
MQTADKTDRPFFIIVGNQRSGTNYIRDIFMRQTDIYPYGEVFFPDVHITHNFDGHFFQFYRDKIAEDKYNIFFNNGVIFDALFSSYIDEIVQYSPRKISCFDVKSDCFLTVPRLYECIELMNIRVLHLHRRDRLGRALSQAVLDRCFNVDEQFNPTRSNTAPSVELDPALIARMLSAADGFDTFITKRYPAHQRLSVCYEDLLESPSHWEKIRNFTGFTGDIRPQAAFTKRQGLGTKSRVSNYDEIVRFLTDNNLLAP